MLLITLLLAILPAILLQMAQFRAKNASEKRVITIVLALLLATALILLISEFNLPAAVQIGASAFVICVLSFRIFFSHFWPKIFYHGLLVTLLIWCGYLYTISQIPYSDQPFWAISSNQPHPFSEQDLSLYPLTGLPLLANVSVAEPPRQPADSRQARAQFAETALEWQALWPLMAIDSRIRQVLQSLREQQQQNLTAFANQLNSASVETTQMRRRALDRSNIDDLLHESAISQARYKTLVETWNLLDRDEQAFKKRQLDERFHGLLALLADNAVDESHKVDLIHFMVEHFAADIRLLNPLISLYDALDRDYPRLQRLNKDYLQLYLNKREAILHGFEVIGKPAEAALLDYRKKILPTISYSQARLDQFISQRFGIQPPNLYQVSEPKTIAGFLNRKKYPALERFAGASFTEEYIRRSLKKLDNENSAPAADSILMQLSPDQYQQLLVKLASHDTQALDQLVIDPDPAIRANLAWQLARQKQPTTIPLIFELMRDQNPEVRRLAAIAVANFAIKDTQGSSDPKFTEILRMLQNYRSSSDAFSRCWAVAALASLGDKQKALYTLDLILNDGVANQSVVGDASPSWSEAEKQIIQSLITTLSQTPEELLVKTQALKSLQAIGSAEVMDVLLHYLNHIYAAHHTRPGMWRYIVPHLTLPQEAENVEDLIFYLAQTQGTANPQFHKRQLKALNVQLHQAYESNRSGEFFQLLNFLRGFDPHEYEDYLSHTSEQIRIMRIYEYVTATYPFWLVFWPLTLLLTLCFSYLLLPALKLEPVLGDQGKNLANPATFSNLNKTPPPTIVPIKIASPQGERHE